MRKRAGYASSKLLCLTLLSCLCLTTNAGLLWPKPQNEVTGHCIGLPQATLLSSASALPLQTVGDKELYINPKKFGFVTRGYDSGILWDAYPRWAVLVRPCWLSAA